MSQPRAAQRRAEAIERSQGVLAPLACPVTPVAQQPLPRLDVVSAEQGEQEGIGRQRGPQEQFLVALPTPQARALQGQLAFAIAPTHLNLPASRIGIDHAPGVGGARDWLTGQQLPRFLPLAAARHDEPERRPLRPVRASPDGRRQDAGAPQAGSSRIPEQALLLIALPPHQAPGVRGNPASVRAQQQIASRSAQHKAQLEREGGVEP